MLGGLFIGVTLLLPRGIIGTYEHWRGMRRDSAAASASNAAPHAAE
jgi:urea transport system permease protein